MSKAAVAARKFGTHPFWWRRMQFRREFRRLVAGLPDTDTIILSREQFTGSLPGYSTVFRRRVTDFRAAAAPLAREMVTLLRRRFGQGTQIEILFSLREGESWIKSVYGHILRSRKLTEDFAQFRESFPAIIDLAQQAREIGDASGADKLHFSTLEATGAHRLGPASALIELLSLDEPVRDALPSAPIKNAGISAKMQEELLELNRSNLGKAALIAAKKPLQSREIK
jgi:hypothetical protein